MKVESVNLFKVKNAPLHHTEKYENSELVVRRGQAFDVEVILAKDYNETAGHSVSVELQWGKLKSFCLNFANTN